MTALKMTNSMEAAAPTDVRIIPARINFNRFSSGDSTILSSICSAQHSRNQAFGFDSM
jgi:hypothetical protein